MSKSFKQFLIEELSPRQIFDVVDEICNNCKPYLNEIKEPHNFMLYRGVDLDIPYTSAIHNTHRDRVPSDMSPVFHKALDDWFYNRYHIRFRSNNAMFCTPVKNQASLYGNIGVVYPIGKINYIWSPQIHDLYDYIQRHKTPSDITVEAAYKSINKWFEADGVVYHFNTQLSSNTTGEVMIQVPSYYVIPLTTQKIIEYGLVKRMK